MLQRNVFMKAFWSVLLLQVLLCASGCRPPQKKAGTSEIANQFNEARDLVHNSEFAEAERALSQFLSEHPSHKLASRARFLMAKTYMGLNDLPNATLGFEATIRDYPDSEEAHKSKFKLAMLSVLQEDKVRAAAQLESLRGEVGAYAPEVEAWLAKLVNPEPEQR